MLYICLPQHALKENLMSAKHNFSITVLFSTLILISCYKLLYFLRFYDWELNYKLKSNNQKYQLQHQ